MKYYIIAGEASGDMHASKLIREISELDSNSCFRGFGGELMEQSGMELVKHYREMAYMGLLPVLLNLQTIKRNFRLCEQDVLKFNPDVIVLVDYAGFNLRMAAFAKKNGIRVFYYISPKVWAWRRDRVKKIKAFVDEMFTILPFEAAFFQSYGISANYVGNPLLDTVLEKKSEAGFDTFIKENGLEDKPVIALLPGSRKAEITALLPTMIETVSEFNEYQVVIAGAPNMDAKNYEKITGDTFNIIWGRTYEILSYSRAALVASGTASLETAILNVPQVVGYQMKPVFLFHILKKLFLKVQWVSLVNIILGRGAVKELLQLEYNKNNLKAELSEILTNNKYRSKILADYAEMMDKLGKPGASKKAAEMMLEKLKLNK